MYMSKTFFYNFFPSKAEEDELKARNEEHKVTRTLVEINDFYSRPINECDNLGMIKKRLTSFEVLGRRIGVSFIDTFRHVFRYWPLQTANLVVTCNKVRVTVLDVTDSGNRKRYHDDTVYFMMLPDDNYALHCKQLFDDHRLLIGDEIGLAWDPMTSSFHFKLLHRAI